MFKLYSSQKIYSSIIIILDKLESLSEKRDIPSDLRAYHKHQFFATHSQLAMLGNLRSFNYNADALPIIFTLICEL